MINLLAIGIMVASCLVGSFASIMMKKGAKDFNFSIMTQLKNTKLVIGVLLTVASVAIYSVALSMERLSIIYPLSSLSYVFVAFMSVKLLNDKMNTNKWTGVALIMIGIVLIAAF